MHAHKFALMRQQRPLMSQILHFLDFNVKPKDLEMWRAKTLRAHYQDSFQGLEYNAPIFLDSGGFKLLWNDKLDLSNFHIEASPETIYQLQTEFGGDLVAALDYPLPPGLATQEAKERMRKSQINALAALRALGTRRDKHQFMYVPVHGQDSNSMRTYVKNIFRQVEASGLTGLPFGIAVGSLVPLRGVQNHVAIIELVQAAIAAIPQGAKDITPVHVFGVTGSLVPLLIYLGVDTFDSSTYVQKARNLLYIIPETRASQSVLRLDELSCPCNVCSAISLRELQAAFTTSGKRNRPLPDGEYRSKYYADIALHNVEMDFKIVAETSSALEADSLEEYLVHHVDQYPQLRDALEVAAHDNAHLRRRITRTVIAWPKSLSKAKTEPTISLELTPDAFDVSRLPYCPPPAKKVLLIIPCSGTKPYSTSRSHRAIAAHLQQTLGKHANVIHKVTLSGLYGPVPEEYENEAAVLRYDFRLGSVHSAQIALLGERLSQFLARHSSRYDLCVGYATSRAYRTVLESIDKATTSLIVFPRELNTHTLREFYRKANMHELSDVIATAVHVKQLVAYRGTSDNPD